MKNYLILPFLFILMLFSSSYSAQKKGFYENVQKKNVAKVLDDLNLFAATSQYKEYFDLYAEESVFIGTDATEVWTKKEFMDYAKSAFEKPVAWDFKSLKRNIYFSQDGKYAWFDEILDSWMKICRGSGVLVKIGNKWKIKQYVLSMTVPNDNTKEVVKTKAPIEDKYLEELKK